VKGLLKNEKGFSLLEVVIAMLILALISVGVSSALSNVTKSTTHANVTQGAGNLAASVMEIIKHQPYAASYTADTTLLDQFPEGTCRAMRFPCLLWIW
jgi:prepilin-type N-terminal cleavage/methylation domain-containing protein